MTTECAAPLQQDLLHTMLAQLRSASDEGIVVAVTSANSGEGVTHSVAAIPNTLQIEGGKRILRVSSRDLSNANCSPASLFRCCKRVGDNLFDFRITATPSSPVHPRHVWADDWKYRRDCIAQLRSSFDFILIDCPAIKAIDDVLILAPLVSGVIIVVEADKTRIEEILQAETSIERAGGKLLGHILNKRRLGLPGWMERVLR